MHLRAMTERVKGKSGFSLLEMAFATALLAGTLVPALAVMRDAIAISRETETRALLVNYAVLKIEEYASLAIATWGEATNTEDFTADGYANIMCISTTSDEPSDGGIVDGLMSVEVTVFDDENGNSTLDSGELSVEMRTKVAKLGTYEHEEL